MKLYLVICLALICTFTYAQTGTAFLTRFITNYNASIQIIKCQENYNACYRLLSAGARAKIPATNVTKALTGMMMSYGKIGFQQYYGPIADEKNLKAQLAVVGFTQNSALSYFVWYEQGKNVLYYALATEASSLVNLFTTYLRNTSCTVLLNGKQQLNINGNVQRPLDALLVFPVAVEYANQVLQGKIKSTTRIYSKDVINYYLPGFDTTLDYWGEPKESYLFSEIITVLSLAPSPALAEYIVDFLGIDNVRATSQAFGFNSSAYLYPASYRVAFANPMNMSSDDFKTYLQNYNMTQLEADVNAIHLQLKAGNLTSIIENLDTYLTDGEVASYLNLCQPTASTSVIANAVYKFASGNFKLASGVSTQRLVQMVGSTISPNWYQRQAPSAIQKLYSYAAEFTSRSIPSIRGGFFSGMVYIEYPKGNANKNIVLVLSASGVNQTVADRFETTTGIAYPMIALNTAYRNVVMTRLKTLQK